MKADVMLVTPELAREWLKHNDANRTLRRTRVLQYAHDMREGKWNLTGQGITFDVDGNLLDGQHRLWAVIHANVPVKMLIVTDAEPVSTYDCGMSRSMVDRFKLSGKNGGPIYTAAGQAVVRLCYIIEKYGTVVAKLSPTTSDIEQYIADNPDLEWAASLMEKKYSTLRGLRRSVIGASLYSIYKLNVGITKCDVNHICEVLKTGIIVYDYDVPIIALRNKLITTSTSAGNGVNKELFLRIQYMCKQYLNKSTTLRTVYVKDNIFDFTKLNAKSI